MLSVGAPGGMTVVENSSQSVTCATNDKMYCCIAKAVEGYQPASIVCGSADYGMAYQYELPYKRTLCYGKEGTVNAQVCQNVGITQIGRNLVTPVGHRAGYTVYSM